MPSQPPSEDAKLAKRKAKVVEAFMADFSLDEAKGNPSMLSSKQARRWKYFTASGRAFPKEDGGRGAWYPDVLPELMARAGWFASLEGAKTFSSEVKSISIRMGAQVTAKKNMKFSKEEIVAEFMRQFPSRERAMADPSILHGINFRRQEWYPPARAIFRKKNGGRGTCYSQILPGLMLAAGWFQSFEEAAAFSKRLLANAKRKMSKEEVLALFKKEFPSLEEARKNPCALSYVAVKNFPWYATSRSTFKNEDGGKGTWREVILPSIMVELGWFSSYEQARDFSGEVSLATLKNARKKVALSQRKMTWREVLAAFKNQFPSLDAVMGNPSSLSQQRVKQCAWYNSAVTSFKKPNGKSSSSWYLEVLPQLLVKTGLCSCTTHAVKISEEVKAAAREEGNKKLSAQWAKRAAAGGVRKTRKNEKKAGNSQKKKQKDYAIVVGNLRRAADGINFEGIESCLPLGSTETAPSRERGMPRAVVTAPKATYNELTPGELLRLRTNTKNWSGETAKAYSGAFSHIAPYLTTRLLMLHAFGLVRKREIYPLKKGVSLMSGPGEVHGALESLRPELEKHGIKLPFVLDVDMEPDILSKSGNPNRVCAKSPDIPIKARALDFVECSSLYQFNHRKFPTIVRDTLAEAARVLDTYGVLLLTSTAKKFSEGFEEGLRKLGFNIITPANTQIGLNEETKGKILEEMGPGMLAKTERAIGSTHYLVAMKIRGVEKDVPAEHFRFEKVAQELPEDAKSLAAQARSLDKDIGTSTYAATANLERIVGMLEGLSPQAHQKNAQLIQAIESKYLLDPKIRKPGKEMDLVENAGKLTREAERVGAGEKDRYFILLRRMTKTHTAKLREAKRANPGRVQPKLG